jgi:hypothetical protein
MSTASFVPRTLRAGLVIVDPANGRVLRAIALQYNPDALSRTLQIQGAGEGGDRLEALRLKGPPVETLRIEAELDAADQLEFPDERNNRLAVEVGVGAQLAALEALLYPPSAQLAAQDALAARGTIEVLPVLSPLPLFVWSRQRVLPVRVTEFGIAEEAFDPALNPVRAKVTLGLRVLSINDVPFDSTAGTLFRAHQQQKEALAARSGGVPLEALGIGGLL